MNSPLPLVGILAYLIGSIPCGLLIGRLNGVDIRTLGSGNIGATNVFRCVGKGWGISAFILDFFKGFVPAFWLPAWLMEAPPAHAGILAGALAVAGHNWPVWLKFRGGKGVATSAGMLAGIAPWTIGAGLVAWSLTMLATRIVSVASMVAAVAVAISGWVFYRADGPLLPSVLTVLGALVILRHRHNIARLMRGEEHGFGKKKPDQTTREPGSNEEKNHGA